MNDNMILSSSLIYFRKMNVNEVTEVNEVNRLKIEMLNAAISRLEERKKGIWSNIDKCIYEIEIKQQEMNLNSQVNKVTDINKITEILCILDGDLLRTDAQIYRLTNQLKAL